MTQQELAVVNPNATTLIMGDGGSGKSSLLATVAEYVWEKHKLWSSYYLIDGGGVPTQVSALQNKGIIKLWRVRTRGAVDHTLILETMHRASLGYWPRRINPQTGEAAGDVELIAPTTAQLVVSCRECGKVEGVFAHQAQIPGMALCSGCGKPLNSQTRNTQKEMRVTPGFEKRGACLFDGVSSAGEWAMESISGLNLGGEKSALGGTITSGGMTFGTGNRAQVGFIQTRQLQWLANGGAIPGLVVPAVWTALTSEATDEGLRVLGPKLQGQAKTTTAPASVGNLLEAIACNNDQGQPVRRLHIKAFVDATGVKHLLKPRAYPALLPAVLEDPDSDDPKQDRFVNFNLGKFFELMEQARLQNEQMIDAKFADAPGITSAIEEFGGASVPMGVSGGPSGSAPAATKPTPGGGAGVGAGRAAAPAPRTATPRRTTANSPAQVTQAAPATQPAAPPAAPAPAPSAPAVVEAPAVATDPGVSTSTPAAAAGAGETSASSPSVPVEAASGEAKATGTPTPAPVQTSTSPTTPQPPPMAMRPPARGPVAAPPGRRPVPVAPKPQGT